MAAPPELGEGVVEDLVDDTKLLGFHRAHETIPLHAVDDVIEGLPGVLHIQSVDLTLQLHDFFRLENKCAFHVNNSTIIYYLDEKKNYIKFILKLYLKKSDTFNTAKKKIQKLTLSNFNAH